MQVCESLFLLLINIFLCIAGEGAGSERQGKKCDLDLFEGQVSPRLSVFFSLQICKVMVFTLTTWEVFLFIALPDDK